MGLHFRADVFTPLSPLVIFSILASIYFISEHHIPTITHKMTSHPQVSSLNLSRAVEPILTAGINYNETSTKTNDVLQGNDDNVTVTQTLIKLNSELSTMCNDVKLMPEGSMPVIALASLPGSGNTWLRHLIERVTGIYTGSVYNDTSLSKGGFVGESCDPFSGRTVVVKLHLLNKTPWKIERTIFLVRNLYEAIQSEFNRHAAGLQKGEHTKIIKESFYKRKVWPHSVKISLLMWRKLLAKLIVNCGRQDRLLVVNYQDLKTDLPNQLRRIVDFLGLPLDEERLECTLRQAEGKFHRPEYNTSFNPFDSSLIHLVEKVKANTLKKWKSNNLSPLLVI